MHALAFIAMLATLPVVPGKLTQELVEILNKTAPSEKITVIVHMNTEYPYKYLSGISYQERCTVFKTIAENSQKEVVEFINSLPKDKAEIMARFWIFNGFHLQATRDVIKELARRDDIWFICNDGIVRLVYNEGEEVKPRIPEWNISKVMADSCWAAGYSGEGIILGQLDTGVDVNHPALSGKWLSPYWYDGVNGQPNPYDDHGHGTHTMGTICGGDGPGPFTNDVGVAYEAQFIPTKAFNAAGSGQYTWIDNCMQYLANLKQGGVDIRAIGNSWGTNNSSDLHWWSIVLNWKNLGVFPVFSNGNNGPQVAAPASYPTTIGVGATNVSDNIAGFSNPGPAPNINPINDPTYWYYPSWNLLKPDVSAPGVDVRSSIPGGGYDSYSGTSMASPHVTGGVALLLQKNPNLTVTELYELFYQYCDQPSQGAPYPNYNYGWGRINLWHSLQNTPTSNSPNVVLRRTNIVNDNNGNGKLDPGENGGIVTYIKNTGGVTATNVNGILRTTSSYITINDSLYTYGTLNPGDSANNLFDPYEVYASASTPPGTVANFQLVLVASETTWVRNFSHVIGVAPGTIIWGPKPAPGFTANNFIYGVAYDRAGDRIYTMDIYSRTIRYYSSDSFVTFLGAIPAPDTHGTDISYSRYDDRLWCTSFNQRQIWKINKTTGAVLRQFANPANDYPVGLADNGMNRLWLADRRSSLGATQLLYISDTLGNANQYNSPVQGYYNSRCLAYDSLGNSYVQVQTYFDAAATFLDSVGVVEMQGTPPALTGNRFLLNPGWNIRGIEFDPRDGNYWITIVTINGVFVNNIVKVKGFHQPQENIAETKDQTPGGRFNLSITPNPATTDVSFSIRVSHDQDLNLKIYDITGRLVIDLLNDARFTSGIHRLKWQPRGLSAGVYFAMLETDKEITIQKFVLAH